MKSYIKFITNNKHIFLPLLSGLLVGIARTPLGLGLISFFALVPLLTFFDQQYDSKKNLIAAFFYSFSYISVALHWIVLVTLPGFLGLYLLFTGYYFILFTVISFFFKAQHRLRYIAFAAVWIIFDYIQNYGEFRFPWFDIGYSLADYNLLLQVADIGGVALISLLIVSINICINNLKVNLKRNLFYILLILVVWITYGLYRPGSLDIKEPGKKIAIIQASIPQDMKWEQSFLDSTISIYSDLSLEAKEAGASLILWPESAWPLYLARQYKYKLIMKALVSDLDIPIVTGFPNYEFAGDDHPEKYKFYNSASIFYPDGRMGDLYYKNYLVPFGERMPFLKYLPFLWNVHLGQANFEYGNDNVFYDYEGLRFSPQICFEIAFSKQTALMVHNDTDIILNLTNDAWFKHSIGTYQHAVISRFRAIETRRQIVRSANTGISLIVDPTGEYSGYTELFNRTILLGDIKVTKSQTFYTRFFNWLPKLMLLILLLLIIMGFRNRKESRL